MSRFVICVLFLLLASLAGVGAQDADPFSDPGSVAFGGWVAGGGSASHGMIYDAVPWFPDHNDLLTDPLLQLEFGALAALRLAPSIALDLGVGLSRRGRTYQFDSGVQGDASDDTEIRESLVYLAVPAVVSVELPLFGPVRARAGAGLGFNTSIIRGGTATDSNGVITQLPSSWFALDFPRLFSLSGIARIGVSYRLGSVLLGINATYEHHLTPDYSYNRPESAHYQMVNAGVSVLVAPRALPLE